MKSALLCAWVALIYILQFGFVVVAGIPALFNTGWFGMLVSAFIVAVEVTIAFYLLHLKGIL